MNISDVDCIIGRLLVHMNTFKGGGWSPVKMEISGVDFSIDYSSKLLVDLEGRL